MTIICCNGEAREETDKIISSGQMYTWNHLCFTMDLKQFKYGIFLNNSTYKGTIRKGKEKNLSIRGGGILILGQEQDRLGGGFNVLQSFEGIFADYTVASGIVDDTTIATFFTCSKKNINDSFITFDDFSNHWTTNGSVELLALNSTQVCSQRVDEYILFSEQRSFDDSMDMCRKLKGSIALPKNADDNSKLTSIALKKLEKCNAGWGVFLWLGAKGTLLKNELWEYRNEMSGEQIGYTNFREENISPVPAFKCLYLSSVEKGKWVQFPCIFKTCVVCSFRTPTVLRFRGLCEDSLIDRYYLINGEFNGKPLFSGIGHSTIRSTNTSWELIDSLNPDLSAIMNATEIGQNPVGLRKWIISGDKCEETTLQLLLTACQAHQYTCDDGTCIEKMQRCDLTVNCRDQSDERLCNPVVVRSDYIREVNI